MGAESQHILRNLCSNTGWHYAVYLKLRQHHSRMVLTWEDAYFAECGQSHPSKYSYESQGCIPNARYINGAIKFALTAASYDVHPFGEGVIGEVAASGKHQWVFGDKQEDPSSSYIEERNRWQSQFAAGIKTIAFFAVAPHGVVQLGSLYKINENMKLVDQIKNSLSALQLSSVNLVAKAIPNNGASDLPADYDCRMQHQQESGSEELGEIYSKMIDGITPQLKVPMDLEAGVIPPTCTMESMHALGNVAFPFDNIGSAFPFHVVDRDSHDRVNFDVLDQYQSLLRSSDIQDSAGINPDIQAILGHSESSNESLRFSAGCELHEALGPAFSKQMRNYGKHNVVFSEGMSSFSSQIAPSSGSEHLLEAVVANIFSNIKDSKSEKTCKSVQSILTTDHVPEVSYDDRMNFPTDPLSIYPSTAKDDMHYCLRTADAYFTSSPTMLSSTCVSSCTEPVSKSSETSKGNKKRARPGESSKPRPRDRQLIQDRIKELRELIPSGAKCSIDSLLERTIKHMQFMQNMAEHADKLKQCAESKMQSKDAVEKSSSSLEQGSSWAVEVGGQFKVCRILVENVNMNRQMLIEMLCEECSHFLEIAEVIKSLGLTILKGATETCGEKTWICFLVEGQKNKSIQRLDILWSLVHVLQPKNSAQAPCTV